MPGIYPEPILHRIPAALGVRAAAVTPSSASSAARWASRYCLIRRARSSAFMSKILLFTRGGAGRNGPREDRAVAVGGPRHAAASGAGWQPVLRVQPGRPLAGIPAEGTGPGAGASLRYRIANGASRAHAIGLAGARGPRRQRDLAAGSARGRPVSPADLRPPGHPRSCDAAPRWATGGA